MDPCRDSGCGLVHGVRYRAVSAFEIGHLCCCRGGDGGGPPGVPCAELLQCPTPKIVTITYEEISWDSNGSSSIYRSTCTGPVNGIGVRTEYRNATQYVQFGNSGVDWYYFCEYPPSDPGGNVCTYCMSVLFGCDLPCSYLELVYQYENTTQESTVCANSWCRGSGLGGTEPPFRFCFPACRVVTGSSGNQLIEVYTNCVPSDCPHPYEDSSATVTTTGYEPGGPGYMLCVCIPVSGGPQQVVAERICEDPGLTYGTTATMSITYT